MQSRQLANVVFVLFPIVIFLDNALVVVVERISRCGLLSFNFFFLFKFIFYVARAVIMVHISAAYARLLEIFFSNFLLFIVCGNFSLNILFFIKRESH